MSKYHARRVSQDGYAFDSQAEHTRYCELVLMARAGLIEALRVHPRYELLPREGGCRAIRYTADFAYTEGGREVVEDVKGVETEGFRLRWNLFRRRYPTVDARIVKG